MSAVAKHIELFEVAQGKVLEIHISGTLKREDYQGFLPRVEELIQLHGKIRMLVWFHEFHGWTAGALWEDIKFDALYFNYIQRLAMVGEKRWEHAMAVFCRPFTTAKVRYFDHSALESARQWIEET
jgi:hypothetical protein